MALTKQQIEETWYAFAEIYKGANAPPCRFTKPELEAAVKAVDGWLDKNTGKPGRSVYPQPFRKASAAEKATLLTAVLTSRAG